eukprot:264054-Amphidinium_carterae.1
MATIVTRATPSGSRAEGGAVDIPRNVKEFETSSSEYLWYSVLTESQFTTYSQREGHMPVF